MRHYFPWLVEGYLCRINNIILLGEFFSLLPQNSPVLINEERMVLRNSQLFACFSCYFHQLIFKAGCKASSCPFPACHLGLAKASMLLYRKALCLWHLPDCSTLWQVPAVPCRFLAL